MIQDRDAAKRETSELRAWLAKLPVAEAERLLREFLSLGSNAKTGLDVAVSRDGTVEASSLRVLALEQLGRVAPTAAKAESLKVLAQPNDPDEWAVALRNIAWADGEAAHPFLIEKLGQMLQNRAWQSRPTAGYLEAFDVAVHTRAVSLTPLLAPMIQQEGNRAIRHAAFLAIDRITQAAPVPMLRTLLAQPTLLAGKERMRADLFARANVTQPEQRALVESYLADPGRPGEELDQFAATFPNANFMGSYALLSQLPSPSASGRIAEDRAALAVVTEWLQNPALSRAHPYLKARTLPRLKTFVEQGAAPVEK
jgi:hypothetical protein